MNFLPALKKGKGLYFKTGSIRLEDPAAFIMTNIEQSRNNLKGKGVGIMTEVLRLNALYSIFSLVNIFSCFFVREKIMNIVCTPTFKINWTIVEISC